MPEMKWTEEQEKIISLRDRNLLVSAAAGSGKTTVLIERILKTISNEADPVDIDQLLIVTFTSAAALEMRTRLYKAISERVKQMPENRHLRRQLNLIYNAQVSTIDSFCLSILKNYYAEIDLDPAFRVGDTGEIQLLKNDVLSDLLEEKYREGSDAFVSLSEDFATGKDDERLKELILKLYDYSQSAPYPDIWLKNCLDMYHAANVPELLNTPWMLSLREGIRTVLHGAEDKMIQAVSMCHQEAGPLYCLEVYAEDLKQIREILSEEGMDKIRERLLSLAFRKKPSKRGFSGDDRLETLAYELRKQAKKELEDLGKSLSRPFDEELRILKALKPQAETYISLVREFTEAFSLEKRKKNLVDYSDLEHLSIQILLKDGERTRVARMLSQRFYEILVDEYQDSNYVQEEILTAVSRMSEGKNNIFMVGDMKQSIYRFRMARPELFTQKYDTYTREDSACQLIELHTNFRSGAPVIDTVNEVFRKLMKRNVGGIEYTKEAELYIGAQKEKEEEKKQAFDRTTQMLVFCPGEEEGDVEKDEELSDAEYEARMAALEIEKLVRSKDQRIYDDSLKDFRPVDYKDIVILLRSSKNTDSIFREALEDLGIPVYVESSEGYFETREVRLVLDLLRIIDNPIQDIPLVSVLHSPLFGFSSEELAQICGNYHVKEEGNGFYGALKVYALEGQDENLKNRLCEFLDILERYRQDASYLSLSSLIRRILDEQKIELFFSGLPGGGQRILNLKALLSRAQKFEETSYKGIFHFIRYIEKLSKTDTDMGEPGSAEDSGQAVRIMTIHKSKGLEFPIVFLCGLGKKFNRQDSRNSVVFHPTLGIGLDLIDHNTRIKERSLIRRALSERTDRENIGEELRVLYVAMTRAKDKLYLLGTEKNPEKIEGILSDPLPAGKKLSDSEILTSENMLGWLLKTCAVSDNVHFTLKSVRDLQREDLLERITETELKKELKDELYLEDEASKRKKEEADRIFSYPYLYDDLHTLRASMSVSALKMALLEEAPESEAMFPDIPEGEVRRTDVSSGGAKRGTLYHLIMEKLDPDKNIHEELMKMTEDGLISSEEAITINEHRIRSFFSSSLGQRFIRAYKNRRGFREKAFIIGVPVKEVTEAELKRSPDELMMIQGIIDMYFEEADGLVLVDYKTDRVRSDSELVSRYKEQLKWYQKALEQITGKIVKEKWIWSFALDKAILLDP